MNVLAEATCQIPVTKVPNDTSDCLYTLEPQKTFHIIGIQKVGVNRVYKVQGGGYVSLKGVHIIRDMEFFYENIGKKDKIVMMNNLSTVGGRGLSKYLDRRETLTEEWFSLNRFADFGVTRDVTSIAGRIGMTGHGGGFGGSVGTVTGGTGSIAGSITRTGYGNTGVGGTVGGTVFNPAGTTSAIPSPNTTVPSVQSTDYRNNVLNTPITNLFSGLDSTTSNLLKGANVSSLTDGSFLSILGNNALDMLWSWGRSKLNFIAGFDIVSVMSSLFGQFGTEWNSVFSQASTGLFGTGGLSRLNSVQRGSLLTDKTNTKNMGSIKSGYGVQFFSVRAGEGDRRQFKYAAVTQQAIDYFKYKGCNGHMIVKSYAGLTWEQDATYATGVMDSKKVDEDLQLWGTLYNNTYEEIQDALDTLKEEFSMPTPKITREFMYTNFNRYRFPVVDYELDSTRGYVFFVRPDLNISVDPSEMRSLGRSYPVFRGFTKYDSSLSDYLQGPNAGEAHEFFPYLTYACTGIDVSDEVLDTIEVGDTFTGWKVPYGTSIVRSKTAGQISVTFKDDDRLSIYKIFKVWVEYINAVYHGEVPPKPMYIRNHQLDYAISIYYFLCKATENNEVLFWTKYTGAFPTSIPSSNFTDSLGNMIKTPTYSVQFSYMKKDDYNPIAISGFNDLSIDMGSGFMPNYTQDTLRTIKTWSGAPYVETPSYDGLYRLKFRGLS